MNNSIIEFSWLVDNDFPFPKGAQFYGTGYTERDGSDDMFSIVVGWIDYDGDVRAATKAEIFALSEDMEASLPQKGEKFYVTSGERVIAKGIAIERSF